MVWASASSPPTARPANCCRFCASVPRSRRCRRSSSRCASAPPGWPTSATPTTRACGASTACRCPAPGLAIVSDHVEGTRLSDILRVAHERNLQLDINAALCLIRQLVPAVALLHENAREVAHGLIAPERLVVTPHARLVIVEHVLGAAVEQLQFSRERLWQEFRIAMPPSAGMPRFDHRADVTGVGLVALALVLGRPLRAGRVPQPHADAAERGARAHRARRRAAAVAAAARLAGARAAARYAPGVRVGARGARRRSRKSSPTIDVCRGASGARDVSVALHRRAARPGGSRAAGSRSCAGREHSGGIDAARAGAAAVQAVWRVAVGHRRAAPPASPTPHFGLHSTSHPAAAPEAAPAGSLVDRSTPPFMRPETPSTEPPRPVTPIVSAPFSLAPRAALPITPSVAPAAVVRLRRFPRLPPFRCRRRRRQSGHRGASGSERGEGGRLAAAQPPPCRHQRADCR